MKTLFVLNTKNSSYVFAAAPSGHLLHLHYGQPVSFTGVEPDSAVVIQDLMEDDKLSRETAPLFEKKEFVTGNGLMYAEDYSQFCLEDECLEVSFYGKGDIREPFAEIVYGDGSSTSDFLFESAEIKHGKEKLTTMPAAVGSQEEVSQLKVVLRERYHRLKLVLLYSVFPACDTIARSAVLINEGEETVHIQRLMSLQLDFDRTGFRFSHFTGAWIREMGRQDHICNSGLFVNQIMAGVSSNRANPFVMLSDPGTTEDSGECYGFHLLYSGNHYEALEAGPHEKSRLVSGINPRGFSWELGPGEHFESPEGTMTFCAEGLGELSRRIHDFVRKHIVRGYWRDKERPILINSWEANYFKFNEGKLLKQAKRAREAGIELFVMDDGWFGKRNDDTSSLGDWEPDAKKLPGGIRQLADKVNGLGMEFGIWVEPEMINTDSDCYRKHPDWAVQIPGQEHSEGRNQRILDLTRTEVREYVIEAMTKVFGAGNIAYVKWDMNRIFSDAYSTALAPARQGEFYHRYVCGLYEIMGVLVERFPKILFEGCASGGNRFDLGILCFMPQIWASDNTDAFCRAGIQQGYSYGYPPSVIGAHVSSCPNHQTLRNTPLATRFHVATFGLLGYELNLCELPEKEIEEIKGQILLYKQWRRLISTGDFYRLSAGSREEYCWMIADKEKQRALYGVILGVKPEAGQVYRKLRFRGLAEDKRYQVSSLSKPIDIKIFGGLINMIAPVHIKQDSLVHNLAARYVKMTEAGESYTTYGRNLNHCGLKLQQAYGGTGFNEQTRIEKDFTSELYFIEAE